MENSTQKSNTQDKYKEELLLSRRILKNEMNRAIKAIKPAEKVELVRVWKEVYKPEIVDELLRVARDKEARLRIANWNLDNFDGERRKK
jgi:DNA recombination-dependent growth factor C